MTNDELTIPKVYLAGPNVFYSNPIEERERKKSIVRATGFEPLYPFDSEVKDFKRNQDAARIIASKNEEQMKKSQIILANMEPWHGPSTDIGTGFEMGYMSCKADLSPKSILIIGYYEHGEHRLFLQRVNEDIYHGQVKILSNGDAISPDGMHLENFGLEDNLMLVSAIDKTGGRIFQSFPDAVRAAKELWEQKRCIPLIPNIYAASGN
jgi:nucleoside 2-deoxyribosyltransferase